jgi:hypothetical protein
VRLVWAGGRLGVVQAASQWTAVVYAAASLGALFLGVSIGSSVFFG